MGKKENATHILHCFAAEFTRSYVLIQIDPKSYCMPSTATYSKKVTRHSELGHLKVVKLEGFTNKEDEISLAENFTKLGAVEPLIIATTDGICLRSLVKAPLYQPKQQCRSNLERVAPWSHDRKYTYKFVEVIGDINEVCPKHAHMGP
jgi:hypothetical protein